MPACPDASGMASAEPPCVARSGLRSVAMKVTGHRTEAVYLEVAIVSDTELREATRRLAATGTFPGTLAPSVVESCTATVRPSEQTAV
jgi:hypothetical protein